MFQSLLFEIKIRITNAPLKSKASISPNKMPGRFLYGQIGLKYVLMNVTGDNITEQHIQLRLIIHIHFFNIVVDEQGDQRIFRFEMHIKTPLCYLCMLNDVIDADSIIPILMK